MEGGGNHEVSVSTQPSLRGDFPFHIHDHKQPKKIPKKRVANKELLLNFGSRMVFSSGSRRNITELLVLKNGGRRKENLVFPSATMTQQGGLVRCFFDVTIGGQEGK